MDILPRADAMTTLRIRVYIRAIPASVATLARELDMSETILRPRARRRAHERRTHPAERPCGRVPPGR